MIRVLRQALLTLALLALVAGCSGGGDDDDSTDEATDAATDQATDGDGGDFCEQAQDLQDELGEGTDDSLSDEGFEQLQTLHDAFQDIEPPDEIAEDWEANIEGLEQLIDIVEAAREEGIDEDTPADDPRVEQLFTDLGELDTSASEAVIAYLEEECGLGADSSGDDGNDATGPIAFEDLQDRCNELTDLATTLRGEEPAAVDVDEPPEPAQVTTEVNGVEAAWAEAECRFTYEGDSFDEPNRIRFGMRQAEGGGPLEGDDLAGAYGECAEGEIPFGEEVGVNGVGDEACFRTEVSFDAESELVTQVGGIVVYLVVSVPAELEGSPFLGLEPVTTAALDFLALLDV